MRSDTRAAADAGDPLLTGSGETADGTVLDFAITGPKQHPAGRAAFVSGTSTIAGDITCLRLVRGRAVFGIADSENGGDTVFREFYAKDDGERERLIALGSRHSEPKKRCSAKLPRAGSGMLVARGSITFARRHDRHPRRYRAELGPGRRDANGGALDARVGSAFGRFALTRRSPTAQRGRAHARRPLSWTRQCAVSHPNSRRSRRPWLLTGPEEA